MPVAIIICFSTRGTLFMRRKKWTDANKQPYLMRTMSCFFLGEEAHGDGMHIDSLIVFSKARLHWSLLMTDVYLDVSYSQWSALARTLKPQSQTQSSELLFSQQCFPPPYLPGRSTHAQSSLPTHEEVFLCVSYLGQQYIYSPGAGKISLKSRTFGWN